MKKNYQSLEKNFADISKLQHASNILSWDEAVMMPTNSAPQRNDTLAYLAELSHEKITNPTLLTLFQAAQQEPLSAWEQRNLSLMQHQYEQKNSLPASLVSQLTHATSECEQAWRQLRPQNNWKDFEPLLQKNVDLCLEAAERRSQALSVAPYDILLDDFSPGVSQALIDPLFDELKQSLPTLLDAILNAPPHTPPPLPGPFPIAQQKQLAQDIMHSMGFDFTRGRQDVSHHPFCGGTSTDVRITTRFTDTEFLSSIMGICHETGHALYEQQLPSAWCLQPIGQALGMTVHESQSLLMERQVCRSPAFMTLLAQRAQHYFGQQTALTPESLYQHCSQVKPSLIRVDADEVTYPFHIILRYEIERDLFNQTLQVKDLPEAWNDKMQHYLSLSTLDDYTNGVMQDVHWPAGLFGYFPAYTLGRLMAAQLYTGIEITLPDINQHIANGDFTQLNQWLKENIHQKASSLSFSDLMKEATGSTLQTDSFIQHLNNRYLRP